MMVAMMVAEMETKKVVLWERLKVSRKAAMLDSNNI